MGRGVGKIKCGYVGWRLRNRNIENQSLLLAVRIILEQVVGDELNRVGWPELMRIIPFLG